ncbi:hypothetical protein ANO11243_069080 [Dothideomycetidae sp. 11243]|nr:hypothetical protein ANO11243_069080 [fungal sp. No.11243]
MTAMTARDQHSFTNDGTVPQGKIVVLNWFPGTGKYTILRRVKELLSVHAYLLDNHLLIDPVFALIPDRTPEHHELRRQVRAPIFQTISTMVQQGHVILMTACLVENSETDSRFLEEHLDMVRGTQTPIYLINAYCEPAVLEQRVASPERVQGIKTKLTDSNVARMLLQRHRLIEAYTSEDDHLNLVVESLDVGGEVDVSARSLRQITGLCQTDEDDTSHLQKPMPNATTRA